ncbi:MAG: hypothetical protein GWN66_23070, partial [Pseudomonas stutzeri]|nr:hypothetical protein [Stutzerimonas stutzeri]
WDETLADWREALAAYDELGDAEAVGRICHEMSVQFIWAARPEEAMETARHGLMALGERVTVDR